jgi:hypothetical protein
MQKKQPSAKRGAKTARKSRKIKIPLESHLQWPEEIGIKQVILPDGSFHFVVSPRFATMCCLYFPEELRERLSYHVQALLKGLLKGVVKEDPEGHQFLEVDERDWTAVGRKLDPVLRELINKYTDYAYNMFTKTILTKMYQLPELLVDRIMHRVISMVDEDDLIPFKLKGGNRKMWEVLADEAAKELKYDWSDLKPGIKPVTSKQERAEMLAYYYEVLPACQQAKQLYKRISARRWKGTVKAQFPAFDDIVLDNLPNHKPSWLAELLTGRHFRKIIGKDLKGLPEVRRQLGIARGEASA